MPLDQRRIEVKEALPKVLGEEKGRIVGRDVIEEDSADSPVTVSVFDVEVIVTIIAKERVTGDFGMLVTKIF